MIFCHKGITPARRCQSPISSNFHGYCFLGNNNHYFGLNQLFAISAINSEIVKPNQSITQNTDRILNLELPEKQSGVLLDACRYPYGKSYVVCNENRKNHDRIRIIPYRKFLSDLWEGKIIKYSVSEWEKVKW